MLNNFIYAKTKDLFLKELESGNVSDEAIVFIEDTKEIWNHGTYFGSEKLINITYSELKLLRDNSQLVPGSFYRITDYVTTTTQSETKSANHPFDVIVLALSENTLCEDAKAILHEGDTYFADSDLSAWELKYCLDNDKTRFAWADETNGKGVIYRMIDEKRNDCPYDFKNILFYNTTLTSDTTSDKYYYTFSYVVSDVLYDGTTEKQAVYCYDNVMGGYYQAGVLRLNKNVFRNSSFSYSSRFNILRENCYSNTFRDNCFYNTFGINCSSNTFGRDCYLNTFGNNCISNELGDNCSFNTLESFVQNRSLDSDTTTLTLRINEEFYDDGSGQLVPIKHPDLSTQPSILPYKFMGQNVYEQLIPILELASTITFSPIVENPLFIECSMIGESCYDTLQCVNYESNTKLLSFMNPGSAEYLRRAKYIKVIYTSIPEEGGYYGYNNYSEGGVTIPNSGMVIELPISGEYIVKTTDGVVAKYLGDNLYHFPLEVIQDYGGLMMIQVPEISIDRGDVSGGSVSVKPVYIEIHYPNEELVKVTLYGK